VTINSFGHSIGNGQTDRQTDGRTDLLQQYRALDTLYADAHKKTRDAMKMMITDDDKQSKRSLNGVISTVDEPSEHSVSKETRIMSLNMRC